MITPNKAIIPSDWNFWTITIQDDRFINMGTTGSAIVTGLTMNNIKSILTTQLNDYGFPFLSLCIKDLNGDGLILMTIGSLGYYNADDDFNLVLMCTGVYMIQGNYSNRTGYIQISEESSIYLSLN